eukprot:scaffold3577_cov114-Skeletonema_dohrnii-CCMP3373.AAC.10
MNHFVKKAIEIAEALEPRIQCHNFIVGSNDITTISTIIIMKLQLILSAALALLSTAPTAVSAAYPVSGFDFDSADLEDEASFFANRPFGDCGGGIGINSCGRVPGCVWTGSQRSGRCRRSGSGGGSSSSSSIRSGSCFSDRANRNS